MKTKDIKALQTKEITELRKTLREAQTELTGFRLEHSMFKLKNTRSLFTKRKEIAIISTILKEKEKANGKNA